jgi:AcrR family transcriptional regulator
MVSTEHSRNDVPADGRARALREARALFTTQGYATVSMQQIADAAQLNKATLYHHFKDKEDLFVGVMRDEFAAVRAGLSAELAAGTSLREQLRRIATYVLAATRSDVGRLMTDLHESVSEERRAALLGESPHPWGVVRAALERAAAAGEMGAIDPALAVELFFGMIYGQARLAKFGGDRPPPGAEVAATIADVLLDGIGARRQEDATSAPARTSRPADDAPPVERGQAGGPAGSAASRAASPGPRGDHR